MHSLYLLVGQNGVHACFKVGCQGSTLTIPTTFHCQHGYHYESDDLSEENKEEEGAIMKSNVLIILGIARIVPFVDEAQN